MSAGTVEVLYFASLRDAAGAASERVTFDAGDLAALYERLQQNHAFALPRQRLRVAVDGAFANWADPVRDGSVVAFMPPVSGG